MSRIVFLSLRTNRIAARPFYMRHDAFRMMALKNKDQETIRIMDLFVHDWVEPQSKIAKIGKKRRKFWKNSRDARLYAKMMSTLDLKQLIFESYLTIMACNHAWQNPRFFPQETFDLVRAAFVAFTGANFLGKQAGRPGEWSHVKKDTLR